MLAGLMDGRKGYSHCSTYRAKAGLVERLWWAACRHVMCYTCKGQDGLRQVLAWVVACTVPGQHATERLGGLKRLQWAVRSQTTVSIVSATVKWVQYTALSN